MSSSQTGGGRSSSPLTGGGGSSRPPNPNMFLSMLQSIWGFLCQYMRYIIALLVVIVGLPTAWNLLMGVGKNFQPTIPVAVERPEIGTIPITGQEAQQYGSDSDEESDQAVTNSTPVPAETPVPSPEPTPQKTPPTPMPTQAVFAQDPDQQEKESAPVVKPREVQKPVQKQEAREKRKPLVVSAPKPRRMIIVAPPPLAPSAPKQVKLKPAVQVKVVQPQRPYKASQEELEKTSRKVMQWMKEEQ